MPAVSPRTDSVHVGEDAPDWYRDAVIYELHVRAFADSDGDGIGDFQGLIGKLDYLNDLGVTAIWLLPFYPSPLRDDGYDIADYRSVNPAFGTMRDVGRLIRAAHDRGLRVITELVLNHTSDQHPWFQRARRAPRGSRWRNFYVWSDTPDLYREARIIFKDFETSNWTWDPVAEQYYWHRFYSHQPDLNFENAEVRRALFAMVDHWFRMGVDGLRLDAVPYLYERDGTSCENLPETHGFLKELRAHIDRRFPNRMLLAEANQWPEDAAEYFGDGDECHMAFHFPLMPRLFMSIQMEDRFPIIDILQQTPELPEGCQWALFLRNHDELTLEMVTDEERDYMYRVYAHEREARINLGIRRRLAPLLGNDRAKIELMNGLLLSLPGTPVIYYGDEIGMGDNIYLGDRDGVRTPMQWTGDRNAGFSRANPQRLFLPPIIDPEFHYEMVNVENQAKNGGSLLWWMRRMLALRKRYPVFGRGELEFLHPENRRVLAYLREDEDTSVLVVANLSRLAQYVELDLSRFKGAVPLELSGQTHFPPIGELPYLLTLGPYSVYWLALEGPREPAEEGEGALPTITADGSIDALVAGRGREPLERAIARFLPSRRWFPDKARTIRSVTITDSLPIDGARPRLPARLLIVRVEYTEGEPQTFSMLVTVYEGERAENLMGDAPRSVIARLGRRGEEGVVAEALSDPDVCRALLDAVRRRRTLKGSSGGRLTARPTPALRRALDGEEPPEPSVFRAEQSNTSVLYGQSLILKVFRRVEAGVNPDLELGRYLGERSAFENIPAVAGAIEYQADGAEPSTLAILHEFVPNEGDAWQYTLDTLSRFLEAVLTERLPQEAEPPATPPGDMLDRARLPLPEEGDELVGSYLQSAQLMGQRVAEMHRALAADAADPGLAPEPFTPHFQRGVYQSLRNLTGRAMRLLRRKLGDLEPGPRAEAEALIGAEDDLLARFAALNARPLSAMRIRCHGDLHLGQVLFTGRDFMIIDFEGEPARSLNDRRVKRSPLRDVAGMLRSFHYATFTALHEGSLRGLVDPESDAARRLEDWGRAWCDTVSTAFLRSYLEHSEGASWIPEDAGDLAMLLDTSLLEKAVYELTYELNNRPEWVPIALTGLRDLLGR
ncbi:maltose alpha-D-glucosyltransferase [Miltoncostaea marina]|uniref:maltose alpha-D-glucosyltransferase n=1 Tax=Miltoncostaea marina TaxID=2843215 RepID=UPI003CCE9BCF